jgi:hypothetical protein
MDTTYAKKIRARRFAPWHCRALILVCVSPNGLRKGIPIGLGWTNTPRHPWLHGKSRPRALGGVAQKSIHFIHFVQPCVAQHTRRYGHDIP